MRATVPPSIWWKGAVDKGLTLVLRSRLPLPFNFFKSWELHDFHTSMWSRVNPSAQIKRTQLGRSCIDKPTMEMVSVSRYGGYPQRESLATAFRVYRSVDQSEEARRVGEEVVRRIQFDDFTFDEDEEIHELAIEFACLYLNASALFGVSPPREMMVKLFSRLSKLLDKPFHWECVLCSLLAHMQSIAGTEATTIAMVFVKMLREAPPGSLPGKLSHNGEILLLITTSRAMSLLPRTNEGVEDCRYLLDIQLRALEMLCATRTGPVTLEEHLVVVDTVCWRHATFSRLGEDGADTAVDTMWAEKVMPLLQEIAQTSLEPLAVLPSAKLFCAMCVTLAIRHFAAAGKGHEEQWRLLDPLVRHLDQHVRVHSVSSMIYVFVGFLANESARLRYRKFPSALLNHFREQLKKPKDNESGPFSFWRNDDVDCLQALICVLAQLGSDGEDELAYAAWTIVKSFSSAVQGGVGEELGMHGGTMADE